MVKNLPAMLETQVPSLDREDPWRREWQPTPVFLPTESNGQRSLEVSQRIGHGARKESDTTERLTHNGSSRRVYLPLLMGSQEFALQLVIA